METGTVKIKTLLVSLALVIAMELAAGFVYSSSGGADNLLLVLGVTRFLEAIAIAVAVLILEGDLSSLGLSISHAASGFKKGLVWSVCFGLVVLFVSVIMFASVINPLDLLHTRLPVGKGGTVLFFVVGGIVSPVAEEMLFRGVVYGFLRRWGIFVAVTLSTLAFVLVHPGGSGIPLPQITGGILFAVAYEKERNLLVPIVIHVLGNMAIFSFSLV